MKKIKKLTTLLLTLTLCLSVMSFTSFADGGDGSGGGGGRNEPLTLDKCSIEDGATDVDTDLSIKLTFSKNVADITVRDNNTSCISLTKDSLEDAKYEVVYSDEHEDRQFITLNATLDNSTNYVLTVSPELMAKNGMTLDSEYKVTFTTKGDDAMLIEEDEASAKDEASVKDEPAKEETSKNSSLPIIIVVCVIILAAVLVIVLKKKKEN